MSLLSRNDDKATKPIIDRIYNASWVGNITSSEIEDVKNGDKDKDGRKVCQFCRQPVPDGKSDTCSDYCEYEQAGGRSAPAKGRSYSWDDAQIGRGWLTLG